MPKRPPESNGIKVAIIGAGPAGISCAYYLALNGYQVTIFEATPVVGGMLYLGIPEYRLTRYLIRMEFERIFHLGVELKTDWALGRDFSLQTLQNQGFRSIFIGIGTGQSKSLSLPGADLDGVMNGIDFLINVNLGYKVELAEKVLVIGGGNVAIDIARSALREENDAETDDGSATIDAARLALRLGAKEVHVVCLESWEEMPAHRYEIEEAKAEGIIFHTSRAPQRIVDENGKVTGIEVVDVLSVFDSQGRFNPTLLPNTKKQIEGGSIIMAIGQQVDRETLKLDPELELNSNGTIKVDEATLATNLHGIYAGGDAVYGPRIVIDSVANGKLAAKSIMEHLEGNQSRIRTYHFEMIDTSSHSMPDGYERAEREIIPQVNVGRRVGMAEVELGYSEEQAKREADRCLKCNINTIFDARKCILCGGCVDVCPESCLRLVASSRLSIQNGSESALQETTDSFVILKDETLCIRCGLCAKRCPTGAVTMERIIFDEYANA
jgi:NADPH-dependent glutamate synthase beta subunit-like oxidoreductase